MANKTLDLDELMSLRDLTMREMQNRFSISDDQIDRDVAYEKLRRVDRLHNPDTFLGHFYFRDGKFMLLYMGRKGLEDVSREELQSQLGGPGVRLGSRIGKRANHYVYPEKGVAFSSVGDQVLLLEIFPPMSLERYKSRIYEDPGPFIK